MEARKNARSRLRTDTLGEEATCSLPQTGGSPDTTHWIPTAVNGPSRTLQGAPFIRTVGHEPCSLSNPSYAPTMLSCSKKPAPLCTSFFEPGGGSSRHAFLVKASQ